MALSDSWTDADLYYWATWEIGYPTGTSSLFTPAEIIQWVNSWEALLQEELEVCFSRGTATTSLSTLTETALSTDILRLDACYYSPGGTDTRSWRLAPRQQSDLDELAQTWSYDAPAQHPKIIYPIGVGTWGLWPAVQGTATLVFDYVPYRFIGTSTSTVTPLPPWTKASVMSYIGYRFYSKVGPVQDLARAAVYRRLFQHQLQTYKKIRNSYFPQKGERVRPAGSAQANILAPRSRI